MRHNTYFVVYCGKKLVRDLFEKQFFHMTTTLLVSDPSMIWKDIHNRGLEDYAKNYGGKIYGFNVESISLIDSVEVKQEPPSEDDIQFSGDKNLLIEGRKYLVRYAGPEFEYCIGIVRSGTLVEIDSDIPIDLHDTFPVVWAGPLK